MNISTLSVPFSFTKEKSIKNYFLPKTGSESGALFLKIMACHFLYKIKLICKESGMP
jgi:hypothetical protein